MGGELTRRPHLSHCAELSPTLLHVCLRRECEMWPWLFTLNLEAQTWFLSFVTQWPLLSAAWGCEFFILVNLAASVTLTENAEKPWAGQQVPASREQGGFTSNIVGKGFILFSSLWSMQSVNIWVYLWRRKLAMIFHPCLVRNHVRTGARGNQTRDVSEVQVLPQRVSACRPARGYLWFCGVICSNVLFFLSFLLNILSKCILTGQSFLFPWVGFVVLRGSSLQLVIGADIVKPSLITGE